jgi:hypothetical protein
MRMQEQRRGNRDAEKDEEILKSGCVVFLCPCLVLLLLLLIVASIVISFKLRLFCHLPSLSRFLSKRNSCSNP